MARRARGRGSWGQATALSAQLRLPEQASLEESYAVFDLETTGLKPSLDHVIEIGWCVVRDGQHAPVRSLLIQSPVPVSTLIEAITGIDDALLIAEAIPLYDALTEFLTETAGMPLVGHNVVRFDAPFLESACQRAGLPAPPRTVYRDTAALFKAHRLNLQPRRGQDHWSFAQEALARPAPGVKYALDACCTALGVALDGVVRHRAAGDVILTSQLYAVLRGLA